MRTPIARFLVVLLLALASLPSLAGFNVQGLWWRSPGGSESGWGLNIAHQGNTLFATWFTYDAQGGLWLVMPNSTETSPNTYEGRIYRTTGPAFDSASWNSASVVATDVGSARLAFTDEGNGTFTYTIAGVTRTKPITREVFGIAPVCTAGGSPGSEPVFQDTWWADPPGSESGWGVNLTHQGDIIFATWFTYEAGGKGAWFVVSAANRVGRTNTFKGDLYRTTGPSFDSETWNVSQVVVTKVGEATFAFTDNDHGTFAYTLGGVSQTKAITRQVYTSPVTVCRRGADPRNGDYKLLSTDFNPYTLNIDFDQRRYSIRSGTLNVAEGTFGEAVDGTYTFDIPGSAGVRNNARFRTAENLIVGSHPLGGSTALPFIAANRFVTTPGELQSVNLWMFSSDVQPASMPVINSRIQAIRLNGNQMTYCSVAVGAVTTVANCLPENLSTNTLTFNADGTVTWFDVGAVPVNFVFARSGSELIVVRAQSYPGTTGNRRFQLALQDSRSVTAATYEGGVSNGSWGTVAINASAFARLATTAGGFADNVTGALSSAGNGAIPLRIVQGSDGVGYFVLGTPILGAHIAARGSAKAGMIGFGLAR